MNRLLARSFGFALAAILLGSAVVVGAPPAHAADVDVCANGCPHTTIAAAVAAASPNDRVRVGDGLYTESITVNKNLTIDGVPGLGKVEIVPPTGQPALVVTSGTVTVTDLRIGRTAGAPTAVGVRNDGGTVTVGGSATGAGHNIFTNVTTPVIDSTASGINLATTLTNNDFATAVVVVRGTGFADRKIFSTMAQGIAVATTAGDSVEALAGTYAESVTVPSGVALKARSATAEPSLTGNVVIPADATNTSLDHFSIAGDVTVGADTDGTTVDDNAVTGSVAVGAGATDLDVTDNTIGGPVMIATNAVDAAVTNNTFDDAVTIATGSTNVEVTDNTFSATTPVALSHGADASAIADNAFTGRSTDAAIDVFGLGVTLTNNTLDDSAASGSAADPAVAIRLNASADGATIEDHGSLANNDIGVLVADGVTGTHLDRNQIRDNTVAGVLVSLLAGADNEGHENSFSGNAFAVRNRSEFVADFSHNWWGDVTGPKQAANPAGGLGDGDPVFGEVDWMTWCVSAACDDKALQDILPF